MASERSYSQIILPKYPPFNSPAHLHRQQGKPREIKCCVKTEQLARGRASIKMHVSGHLIYAYSTTSCCFSAEMGPVCVRAGNKVMIRYSVSNSCLSQTAILSGSIITIFSLSLCVSAAHTHACGPSTTVAGALPGQAQRCMPTPREHFS